MTSLSSLITDIEQFMFGVPFGVLLKDIITLPGLCILHLNIANTQQLIFGVLFGVLFQEQINVKVKDLSSHVQAFVNPVKHLSNCERTI